MKHTIKLTMLVILLILITPGCKDEPVTTTVDTVTKPVPIKSIPYVFSKEIYKPHTPRNYKIKILGPNPIKPSKKVIENLINIKYDTKQRDIDMKKRVSKYSRKSFLHPNGKLYAEYLHDKVNKFIPDIKHDSYPNALINHEGCIAEVRKGYPGKKCMRFDRRYKGLRDEGYGSLMLTVAYSVRNGKRTGVRFDNIKRLRNKYKTHLRGLNKETILTDPDLQSTAGILLIMELKNKTDNYNLNNEFEQLAVMDYGYNAGLGTFKKEQSLCRVTKGCDHGNWFNKGAIKGINSITRYKSTRKKKAWGNRSAWDISRHHVKDVMTVLLPKWDAYYKKRFKE